MLRVVDNLEDPAHRPACRQAGSLQEMRRSQHAATLLMRSWATAQPSLGALLASPPTSCLAGMNALVNGSIVLRGVGYQRHGEPQCNNIGQPLEQNLSIPEPKDQDGLNTWGAAYELVVYVPAMM